MVPEGDSLSTLSIFPLCGYLVGDGKAMNGRPWTQTVELESVVREGQPHNES